MPSDYSEEMSVFNPDECERISKGMWRFKSRSGASATAIHYTADDDKDPDTPAGEAWYNRATTAYPGGAESHFWRQHYEIDFEATSAQKLIPFFAEKQQYLVIDPIPIDLQIGWKYYSGFDYGKRNHTVWGVYAIDPHGNRYICDEIAGPGEKLGGVPGIAARMFQNPYFTLGAGRSIKADPSIWNKNQALGSGYTSIADLFRKEGILLQKAPLKGQDADNVAIERLLYHYWANPENPTLFIFRNCRTHIRQWKKLRYKELSSVVQGTRALVEQLIDKDNDSWDSWKYAEAAAPAPKKAVLGPPPGSFEAVRRQTISYWKEKTIRAPRWGGSRPLPIGYRIG